MYTGNCKMFVELSKYQQSDATCNDIRYGYDDTNRQSERY